MLFRIGPNFARSAVSLCPSSGPAGIHHSLLKPWLRKSVLELDGTRTRKLSFLFGIFGLLYELTNRIFKLNSKKCNVPCLIFTFLYFDFNSEGLYSASSQRDQRLFFGVRML
jgi:hypothetical protein